MAFDAPGHRIVNHLRGPSLSTESGQGADLGPDQRLRDRRLPYLDWLRGVAVVIMVFSHVIDSWTRDADRQGEPFFTLFFIGGIGSPLFLFLAGVATAMSAASKARRAGDPAAGARAVWRRGWEIFLLGLVFRVQALLLGLGPLRNLFKVDMLNTMGLAMVAASCLWQPRGDRRVRLALLAAVTIAIPMVTPLVRTAAWPGFLPDPLEAYLRPAGPYAAFPLFPWAGFLFAGVMVGELLEATRAAGRSVLRAQTGLALAGMLGIILAWLASLRPAVYPRAQFWHDSPTFFFIRLGILTALVPLAWAVEHGTPARSFSALVTFGRSSLFVYWIHVEMVYGLVANPLKKNLPLWGSLGSAALLCVLLYAIVLWKSRWLERADLPRPIKTLATVIR